MDVPSFSSLLQGFLHPSKIMAIAVDAAGRFEQRRLQVIVGIIDYATAMWDTVTASVARIISSLWITDTSPSEGEAVDVAPQVAEAQPCDDAEIVEDEGHGDEGRHDVVGAAENVQEVSAARGNARANRNSAQQRGNQSRRARRYRAGYAARGVSGETRNMA